MSTEQKIQDAQLFSEIAKVAGLHAESALVLLEAVSDNQQSHAGWVRIEALAGIWEARIKEPAKNQKMANAIINAANKHARASWWLDRKNHNIVRGNFIEDLRQDIKEEMSK